MTNLPCTNKRKADQSEHSATIIWVSVSEVEWVFGIQLTGDPDAIYPLSVKIKKDHLWKVWNLIEATGSSWGVFRAVENCCTTTMSFRINPEAFIGRELGVVLEDGQFESEGNSVIHSIFNQHSDD